MNRSNINVTIANGSPTGVTPPQDYEIVSKNSTMRISLKYPFTSLANTVIDPDVTTISVLPPGATSVVTAYTYTYGIPVPDPSHIIVRDSAGYYHADIDNTSGGEGVWKLTVAGAPGAGLTTTATISACTGNGTTVTYTSVNTLSVGQTVVISGITGGTGGKGYSGSVVIATASGTQFTVTNATTGTATLVSANATNAYDATKTKILYQRSILVN